MPLTIAPISPPAMDLQVPYPAASKQAAATIDDAATNVTSTYFSDKIMVTISQNGRLAQWIQVPLDTLNPNYSDQHIAGDMDADDSLLPISHLSPHTLLGGSSSAREITGQLYATQIASAIITRNPDEKRTVLVGLGLIKTEASREVFYDVIDLVMQCL